MFYNILCVASPLLCVGVALLLIFIHLLEDQDWSIFYFFRNIENGLFPVNDFFLFLLNYWIMSRCFHLEQETIKNVVGITYKYHGHYLN